MTAVVPAADLAFFDRLMASDDVWLQGAEEGRAVAQHIGASAASIIVLYGPARSGSTDFMRRWVVPELERTGRVRFHERGAAPASPLPVADLEIWDGFESHVTDPEGQGRALLEHLASRPEAGAHKTVLILQEDYLNRLFQLRTTVPGILDDLFEIPAMPASRFIDAVARTVSRYGATIDAGCRAAVAEDLAAVRIGGALGPELVAILAFEILRAQRSVPVLDRADYEALGSLKGILESHLEFLLEHAPGEPDPEIGWAVLQRAVRTPVDVVTDLTDVAYRFDVSIEVPQQILTWLELDRGVLRANTGGGHDIVPGLLALAVAARARRRDELTEHVRAMLRYGVRQFAESGALLPDQQFRRINEHRSGLTTTEDEATLMLRCALAHSAPGDQSDTSHWLRRVRNEETTVEILSDMLFDLRPEIRARAATALRAFPTRDVRAQLHLIALRDGDETVRAAAVDSVGVLRTDELCSALVHETADPNSPFQRQAIDALRVFPAPAAVEALVAIVNGAGPVHDAIARAGRSPPLRPTRPLGHGSRSSTSPSRILMPPIAVEPSRPLATSAPMKRLPRCWTPCPRHRRCRAARAGGDHGAPREALSGSPSARRRPSSPTRPSTACC